MLTSFRWYRIQLPRTTPDLASLVDAQPLGQETNHGFTRVHGALGQLIHRFLWRSKVVVTQFDDSGDPVYQEVSTISFTDFAIINLDNVIFLRLENPGRSIKNLLNALESMIGLGFSCKPVTFDRKKPTAVFENIDVIKLIGLKVTDVVLGDDLIARMEFVSTEGITPEKLSVLSGISHKTNSASYELIYGGLRGLLSFNSNGTVKVNGSLAPKLIHLIEKDLPAIM